MSQPMDKLKLIGLNLGRAFNSRSGCLHAVHFLCTVEKQPNLKLKMSPNYFSVISF